MSHVIHRTALVAALVVASTAALSTPMLPVPPCAVSHNHNGKVCQLAVADGGFRQLDGWRIRAGAPEIRKEQGRSYIRMGQPGVGISQIIGLPMGSTVDNRHVPAYWVDLHLRSTPVPFPGALDVRGPATALVRLSLTDSHGENGMVLDQQTVVAGADGWKEINLTVDAEPYLFNAFLKLEVIRNDGETGLGLDISDLSISQLSL